MTQVIHISNKCWSDILEGLINRVVLSGADESAGLTPGDDVVLKSQKGQINTKIVTKVEYPNTDQMIRDQGSSIIIDNALRTSSTIVFYVDTLVPEPRIPCYM